MASNFDWLKIRSLFESGHTAYSIAKGDGMPTKQAIMSRAKVHGWVKPSGNSGLPSATPRTVTQGVLERVIDHLKNGTTLEFACQQERISAGYLRQLRAENPQLDETIGSARAECINSSVRTIREAGGKDWKASAWLLERHPVSRGEFSPPSARYTDNGIQIVMHIDRSKREIDYLDVTPTPPLIEGGGTTTESQTKEEKREDPIVLPIDRKKTGSESEGSGSSGSQGIVIDFPVPTQPPEAKPSPITNVTPASSDTSLRDPLQRTR